MQALFQGWSLDANRGGLPPPKGGFRYHENSRLSPRSAGCSLHGVGTSFLSVIIRRGYTRAFSGLVRIACGNY